MRISRIRLSRKPESKRAIAHRTVGSSRCLRRESVSGRGRMLRSRDRPKAELSTSYRDVFPFSPFAPRSLPASPLLWAVRLPQENKTCGDPRFLDSSILTRRPQPPRRVRGLHYPLARPSIAGFIRFDRLATLAFRLTRLNQVRLRCGSRVCLARLRDGDYSHSTRLLGYVDERTISTVSSFQLTR